MTGVQTCALPISKRHRIAGEVIDLKADGDRLDLGPKAGGEPDGKVQSQVPAAGLKRFGAQGRRGGFAGHGRAEKLRFDFVN